MQRRNHSKNIYRQFDPAALHTLTSQPDARVTSVTPSELGANYAVIYFDQVITANNSPTVAPLWTIGARTLLAFVALSADGKSLTTHWSGAIAVGNTVTMADMATNWGYNTTLGGQFLDYSGTVAAVPTADTFNVVGVDLINPTLATIEFDAPVAAISATELIGFLPDFSGWAIGSATIDGIYSMDTDRIITVNLSDATTSAVNYLIPGGATTFISLTAAHLADAAGVVT
jgi:hypothetical protein